MSGEYRDESESGTERRRSRSGVPDSDAPADDGTSSPSPRKDAPEFGEETPLARSEPEPRAAEPPPKEPPDEPADEPADEDAGPPPLPRLAARRRGRRLVRKPEVVRGPLSPEQRLLILDTWRRSGLSAADFSTLVGLSKHTLYGWKKRFESRGPEGLLDKPRGGPRGSRLSELTRRAIVMLKEANPDWGCQRISDMLLRGPALPASPSAVARVLHEAGYECEEVPTRKHRQPERRFERARPNDLWQSDLFTFTLKRQNRRVYLVAFLDDHSRFVVGYGLHATQSTALVLEVLRAAVTNYRAPREVLTDNGSQYVTWRGRSAFSKELSARGIRHVVATPRRPQTLGKIERFWGSLWRECVETAVFRDLDDARKRIGLYCDHYNFQRPHQGIDGLVPADRYFEAAPEVLRTLKERVDAGALELARGGLPRRPFYLTGNAGGHSFSVHAEGERVYLRRGDGERQEIELAESERSSPTLPEPLAAAGSPTDPEPLAEGEHAPGTSPLDGVLGSEPEPASHQSEQREVDVDVEADDETDVEADDESDHAERPEAPGGAP